MLGCVNIVDHDQTDHFLVGFHLSVYGTSLISSSSLVMPSISVAYRAVLVANKFCIWFLFTTICLSKNLWSGFTCLRKLCKFYWVFFPSDVSHFYENLWFVLFLSQNIADMLKELAKSYNVS